MLNRIHDEKVVTLSDKKTDFKDKYLIIKDVSIICNKYYDINLMPSNEKENIIKKIFLLGGQRNFIKADLTRSQVYIGVFIFFNYNLLLNNFGRNELNNFFYKNFHIQNLYLDCKVFNEYLKEAKDEILKINISNYSSKSIHSYTDAFFGILVNTVLEEKKNLNFTDKSIKENDLKQDRISNISTADEDFSVSSKKHSLSIDLSYDTVDVDYKNISSNYLDKNNIKIIEENGTCDVYVEKNYKKILLWHRNTESLQNFKVFAQGADGEICKKNNAQHLDKIYKIFKRSKVGEDDKEGNKYELRNINTDNLNTLYDLEGLNIDKYFVFGLYNINTGNFEMPYIQGSSIAKSYDSSLCKYVAKNYNNLVMLHDFILALKLFNSKGYFHPDLSIGTNQCSLQNLYFNSKENIIMAVDIDSSCKKGACCAPEGVDSKNLLNDQWLWLLIRCYPEDIISKLNTILDNYYIKYNRAISTDNLFLFFIKQKLLHYNL